MISMDKVTFALDLSGIERADDGDTTHFGGTYIVNGEERQGYGDDRSDNWEWDLIEEIYLKAEEMFGPGIIHTDDVLDVVEGVEVGTIVVYQDGTIEVEE